MRRVHLAAGIARYVWAAPCTAVGLCLVAPAFLFGATARVVDGAIEVALSAFKSSNFPLGALPFNAITFGHVVIAPQPVKQNSTVCEDMSRPTSGNTKGGEYSSSWHTPLRAFGSC